MIIIKHPYHLVDARPWPLTSALRALGLTRGLVVWFHSYRRILILAGLIGLVFSIIQWWRDVTRERTILGLHTRIVETGLKWGVILFITSEVIFFFSFFWAYFHSSLGPTVDVGGVWPPTGVMPFNPFDIPLLNTVILLSSGATVTWAHHAILNKNYKSSLTSLALTVILGLYFTGLQAIEYVEASFRIADSAYGATFFVATGFHGLHVIIGTTFLAVCLIRLTLGHYRDTHHFGFEAAAWYWHFVDVVWLFLFTSIYWWGSYFYSI